MGLLEKIATYSNPISASFAGARDLLYDNPAAPPGVTDPRDKFIKSASSDKSQGLADSIFGTNDPQGYSRVIDQGYESLGQPAQGDPGQRQNVAVHAARGLASAFADRVFAKTGFLPTEEQMRGFVSHNLTPGFAAKFIQGLPPDQVNNLADEYIQGNPDSLINPGVQGQQKSAEEQRLAGLKDQLDKIYKTGEENYVSNYDTSVYNPAKTRAVNDLAGQGMLTNPNSRYTLNQIEGNRGRDISSGINTLESNRAAGQVDLGKTIEDLLQKNQDRSVNQYQFNKTFNAGREDASYNQGLQRQGLDLASQLGRMQAKQNEKGPFDYLNSALNVASTGFKGYSALYPKGLQG